MFAATIVATIVVWNLPSSVFGIDGLTVVQQRVIAIFVMAVMLWRTEAIPARPPAGTHIVEQPVCRSSPALKALHGNGDG